MTGYTQEFKEVVVQKMLSRGKRRMLSICQETGVSSASVYRWIEECGKTGAMKTKERRPQDLSAAEKMKAVIEFEALPEAKAGEYLRRCGLTGEQLKQWKSIWERALETNGEVSFSRSERIEMVRKLKELESDLNRKDKALAETTALLVLKKKANLIWGTLGE